LRRGKKKKREDLRKSIGKEGVTKEHRTEKAKGFGGWVPPLLEEGQKSKDRGGVWESPEPGRIRDQEGGGDSFKRKREIEKVFKEALRKRVAMEKKKSSALVK